MPPMFMTTQTHAEKDKIYITVEGIIGCGKSTLLMGLEGNDFGFDVVPENIVGYTNYFGFNLLEEQQTRDNKLACQVGINNIMFESLMNHSHKRRVIFERGIDSLRIFYKFYKQEFTHLEQSVISEHQRILRRLANNPNRKNITIYMKCDPEKALRRIRRRGRAGEENIDLGFLRRLSDIHDQLLDDNNNNVIVVDANQNTNDIRLSVTKILNETII